MGAIDVAIWLVTGLLAGWLAGAVHPEMVLPHRLAVLGAGAAGAVIGGSIAGMFAATSAVAFLGSVSTAVPSAVALGAMLR